MIRSALRRLRLSLSEFNPIRENPRMSSQVAENSPAAPPGMRRVPRVGSVVLYHRPVWTVHGGESRKGYETLPAIVTKVIPGTRGSVDLTSISGAQLRVAGAGYSESPRPDTWSWPESEWVPDGATP